MDKAISWDYFIEYLLKWERNHSTALFMEENYNHNAKHRKIIFPLHKGETWKGKGSVKHLEFSGKLEPLSPSLTHRSQAHVQVRQSSAFYTSKYLTKHLKSSVSVKILSFFVLCLNVFCSLHNFLEDLL